MSVSPDDPQWLQALTSNYQSAVANTFLLYGSVNDYVPQPDRDQTVRDYLGGRLAAHFSVITYSVDAGIEFPGESSAQENIRQVAAEARSRLERWCGLARPELSEAEKLYGATDPSLDGPADLPKDPDRALPLLMRLLAEADGEDPIYAWKPNPDDGTPLKDEDGNEVPDTTRQIGGGDGSGKRVVVLVDRLDLIVPPCDKGTAQASRLAMLGMLHRIGTNAPMNKLGNLLVLLAPSLEEIHTDLRRTDSGIQAIEVPMADQDARLSYLERTVASRKLQLDGISPRDLARQMAGLGLRHIEDVALRAVKRTDKPYVIDRALVKERKRELMAAEYGGILEVVEPSVSLDDVGGHEAIKAWIRTWVLGPAGSDDPEMQEAFPSGILMSGPSGTGKTMLGRAIAWALGWEFIFIRPENVKSQWVGESEKLWAKAMRGSEAMAPAVLFFDEVDQKVQRGGRGGGGGEAVENNMFGRLLEWMTEPTSRGRLLFLGATNEPQNVDPALKRPGRFGDGKLPLLAPDTPEERAGVIAAALRSRGVFTGAPDEPLPPKLLAIGARTDGWTQAELGDLARRAKVLAKLQHTTIDVALADAVGRMRPATADIRRMTLRALAECDDMTLVPAKWRPLLVQLEKNEEAQATAPRRVQPEGPREARDRSL